MNCPFCGTLHAEPATHCQRCASALPPALCAGCGVSLEWGQTHCTGCAPELQIADEDACPACGTMNDAEADYCAACGSPMAVITRIVKLGDPDDLDPWRVYGVETALVGRDQELKVLHETLDHVTQRSEARMALIGGEQGLGKSRLVAEFERRLEHAFSPTVILRGVCREEVSGAFAVIARMLRKHFYIPDTASPDSARRGLEQAVQSLVGDGADHIVGPLGELMGLKPPREITEQESPREMELSSFQALEAVLRADARRNPLLFILDDVHLAPDSTLRLLIYLFEKLRDSAIFFVFTHHPGSRRVIPPRTAHLELSLSPLSDSEVRDHILGTLRLAEEVPEELVEDLVAAALGNPLSVEELLQILIAEAVIDTRGETWTIDASRARQIEIPNTVEATVEARLRGLSPEERQVLEMAACVGNLFWDELVRCLDGLRRAQDGDIQKPWLDVDGTKRRPVDDILEALERKDMIRREHESRLASHREFTFKHRLERESLYQQISPRIRQRYHRFIAQWVEREMNSVSDGAAEFVARHFARARCLRRAAQYYLDAGDEARQRYANQRAIDLYREALGCLSDADMDLKLRAFHDIGSVFELMGEHDEAMTYYRDMAQYAWLLGDRAKGGAALNKIGRALRGQGLYDEALDLFDRALKLFRRTGDERGVASTLDDIGKIHWLRGDQSRALEYFTAALEMRRSIDDPRSIALSLSHVGSFLAQRGEFRQALRLHKEALDLRKSIGDSTGAASSYNDLAGLCVEQGQVEKAITLFDEALSRAREIGFRGLEAATLNNRGEALIALKRRKEAQRDLDEARQIALQIGEQRVLFDVARNLAALAVSQADRTLALEKIAEALETAHRLESKMLLASGELTRAELHAEYIFDPSLREESIREASAAFARSVELFKETGQHVQRANALASMGNFLVESGELEQGAQILTSAAELYEKLGMKAPLTEIRDLLADLSS